MYSLPQPPYFLLVVGLFIGVTSGLAFDATLRQAVREWADNRSTHTLANLQNGKLVIPFLGICAGICLFLASGVQIFGFPSQISYVIALPLTIGTAALVWFQLSRILILLEKGGSRAIDLDAFE
ncbi:MAG: hypothetical protein SFW36_05845 [Leptolyngbyaceae cyanobacterium bins.59]|nr:hypothetical protein [Leptolyngbyaceae cyanobacterium bins.59]